MKPIKLNAVALVINLFNNIDNHQAAADTVHVTFNSREALLPCVKPATIKYKTVEAKIKPLKRMKCLLTMN